MEFDVGIFWDALTSRAFAEGALVTLTLTLAAHALAIVIALPLALASRSHVRPLRGFVSAYVWLFRGTPTLLQLLFVWNALPQFIPALKAEWFSPFLAALLALTFNEAAYQAEITRAALSAVDEGQRQAGRALGMTRGQVLRHVVLPQAVRVAIPPTANEFISLLKVTSLASVISLRELLTVTSQNIAVNFRFAELYAAALVYYLAITSVLMILQGRLERRLAWTSRARGRRARGQRLEVAAVPEVVSAEHR